MRNNPRMSTAAQTICAQRIVVPTFALAVLELRVVLS